MNREQSRQSGPDKRPSGAREAHDPGSTRFGTTSGSGANEPKHNERKEKSGRFVSHQGGDQTSIEKAPDR
jgi:hypothetical protein